MDISKTVASKFTFKRPSKLKMWADERYAKKQKHYEKMVTLLLLLDDLMILRPCLLKLMKSASGNPNQDSFVRAGVVKAAVIERTNTDVMAVFRKAEIVWNAGEIFLASNNTRKPVNVFDRLVSIWFIRKAYGQNLGIWTCECVRDWELRIRRKESSLVSFFFD